MHHLCGAMKMKYLYSVVANKRLRTLSMIFRVSYGILGHYGKFLDDTSHE